MSLAQVIAGAALAIVAAAGDATACTIPLPRNAQEAFNSDIVVVGRLENYKKTLNDVELTSWRARVLDSPVEGGLRRLLEQSPRWLKQFGMFDFIVEEQLKGEVAERIEVTLADEQFGPPDSVLDGMYMLVLDASHLNAERPLCQAGFLSVVSPACAPPYVIPYPSA